MLVWVHCGSWYYWMLTSIMCRVFVLWIYPAYMHFEVEQLGPMKSRNHRGKHRCTDCNCSHVACSWLTTGLYWLQLYIFPLSHKRSSFFYWNNVYLSLHLRPLSTLGIGILINFIFCSFHSVQLERRLDLVSKKLRQVEKEKSELQRQRDALQADVEKVSDSSAALCSLALLTADLQSWLQPQLGPAIALCTWARIQAHLRRTNTTIVLHGIFYASLWTSLGTTVNFTSSICACDMRINSPGWCGF